MLFLLSLLVRLIARLLVLRNADDGAKDLVILVHGRFPGAGLRFVVVVR